MKSICSNGTLTTVSWSLNSSISARYCKFEAYCHFGLRSEFISSKGLIYCNDISFLQNEEFTDVTISADDETFEAHKLILSACSPYFRGLLNRSPCRHPVIYLNDVSADHVATLLKYMYVGQIAVKKEVNIEQICYNL